MKEGALVISLEPFVAGGGRAVTERNLDDISAILDVSSHDYHSMDASWASGAGKFYVHRVDRAGYADVRARFEGVEERPLDSKMTPLSPSPIPSLIIAHLGRAWPGVRSLSL